MPEPRTRNRNHARLFGLDAERWASLLLRVKGYHVLARNYRGHGGEIDIVARRGSTIVAVEVKARPHLGQAEAAVTPTKLRRIGMAMRQFRSERRLDDSLTYRCDAILIAPRHWPLHRIDIGSLD